MATIDFTPQYVDQLLSMVHAKGELRKQGYVLEPLGEKEMVDRLRCLKCNKRPPKFRPRPPKPSVKKENVKTNAEEKGGYKDSQPFSIASVGLALADNADPAYEGAAKEALQTSLAGAQTDGKGNKPKKPTCQYHPGRHQFKYWTCCGAHVSNPGCLAFDKHTMPSTYTSEFASRHQRHAGPRSDINSPKCVAVALDCEMGQATDGETELIRVTMIDYFTSAVLVDRLVWPDVPLDSLNTKYSGITWAQMNRARRDGTCLQGVAAARAEVWKWVNDDTVVVGHDVRNDFAALKWIHPTVMDSLMLESAARKAVKTEAGNETKQEEVTDDLVGSDSPLPAGQEGSKAEGEQAKKPKGPGLSLKAVTKLLLNRDIQCGSHDSLEDSVASRDIAHYHVVSKMT